MDETSFYGPQLDSPDEDNDSRDSLLPLDELSNAETGTVKLTDEEILRQLEPIHDPNSGLRKARSRKLFPKLDERRLTGTSGLPTLLSTHVSTSITGSEDMYVRLNAFMDVIELWGHHMFPCLKFDDLLYRLEVLGHKKAVKRYLEHMREGIFDKCSMSAQKTWSDVDDSRTALPDDYEENLDWSSSSIAPDKSKKMNASTMTLDSSGRSVQSSTQFTPEQIQRMEENRKRALERLIARQKSENNEKIAAPKRSDQQDEKQSPNASEDSFAEQSSRMLSENEFLAELGFSSEAG
ncbi:TIMELESS-interacting protein [Trichuris trichiura]|uniref:TIMELESS-interacting protein n=1 Tax=Trichuris trichiura TaxID=36087 RepID=A0A077ZGQ9_TRITR|nr:TIMELESS-interacting protein [Trichuris trichiura]